MKASELPIGSKIVDQEGHIVEKIQDNLWQFSNSYGTISYENSAINYLMKTMFTIVES